MFNQYPNETIQQINFTEYRFDYFGEPVRWRIRQSQHGSDYFFAILCEHSVFHKYFPDGQAKLVALYQKSRDSFIERSDRLFFRNLIDSCDIA